MQPNDHIEPNLDAYLAGGLSANERHDLEQHCAACSACAQQLMEGKQVDQLMDNLFAQTRPDAGLEDRTLERLRRKPAQRYGIMYFVFSAAAVIALGIIGAAAQAMVENAGKSKNQVAKTKFDPANEWSFGDFVRGRMFKASNSDEQTVQSAIPLVHTSAVEVAKTISQVYAENIKGLDGVPKEPALHLETDLNNNRLIVSAPKSLLADVEKLVQQIDEGSKNSTQMMKVVSVKDIDPAVVAQALSAIQKTTTKGGGASPSGQGGFGGGFSGGGGGIFPGGGGLGAKSNGDGIGTAKLPDRMPIQVEPVPSLGIVVIRALDPNGLEAALKVIEDAKTGSLTPSQKPDADKLGGLIAGWSSGNTVTPDFFSFEKKAGKPTVRGFRDLDGSITAESGSVVGAPQDYTSVLTGKPLGNNGSPNGGGASNNYYFGIVPALPKPPIGTPSLNVNDVRAPNKAEKNLGFFNPDNGLAKLDPMGTTPQFGGYMPDKKRIEESGYDQKKAEGSVGIINKSETTKTPVRLPIQVEPAAQKQPDPQPMPDPNRKIIRTGEMEFEIDSFYASVDTINGLLKKVTKGTGFVATSNSDKLPNGKMKGAVVVRMPPQHLDDFLAELRAALGKVGELKSQRIGSADVTKQYTDIESELRAARAVETRLIEIIKTGKGEIKDLIAAERELGTWRTKIEKMEGEIRYYNNQVALSTLTITLAEKEILAAVALVLRERVAMNVEVEEVEKAQESIAAGVKAAKGRIVKNDLNVGDAGQVSAIVHVEVPPESAPLFRELLKKLGVVSKYQADRTQQAVGGSAEKSLELKQRTDDVRFELNLYNSANIKPRETLHFRLGVADVAETYRTMRETVAKMKGQIRKSDLNEKDPMNITAELVFNVAATDRAVIDKLVAASGLIVSKHTVQAAINETATERSVGYELALRNIAAIPPRDIFTIAVAAQDVAGSYRKLHDAVTQMKGRIHKGQLNEVDRFNVSAEFDFDAAAADKPALDKLISDIGVTIARKNEQFPAKDESTDQKVGYRLTLKNASGMTPREKAMLAMRVNDVDARAAQLKELVIASKGRVMFSKSERNKNGEMKMVLIFELPHASLDTIVRQIKDGQTPLVYDKELNPQVPDNDLATAQIALTLIAVPDIVPSADEGPLAALHKGLSVAVTILIWCVVFLVSGLAIIVPWLIPIWIVVWLVRRRNAAKTVAVVDAPKVG